MKLHLRTLLDYDDTYSLKGIAMLMVIIGHAVNGYPKTDTGYFYPGWLDCLHMELWAAMGVSIFFFLSGYGMFLALDRRQGSIDMKYVISKVKRLFVPLLVYWVVELITLLIFNRQELTTHIFREIFTFSIHPDVENWFFKVIVPTYIIMFGLFLTRMPGSFRVILLFIISAIYILILRKAAFGLWWYNTIIAFPIGALVAYRKELFEKISPIIVCPVCAAAMASIYLFHFNSILFNAIAPFLFIYLIRIVNINNKLLNFIGVNSFLFYFIECPVLDEIVKFSYSNFPLYCLLGIVVTYLLTRIIKLAVLR
jgi:peptidoglycan/LPS O-acetylase OafA/YrhL